MYFLPFRLCLDHSFKELPLNNFPSFSTGFVPVVLRVQRYIFFLSEQHFHEKKFIYFQLFQFPLKITALERRFPAFPRDSTMKNADFRGFRDVFRKKMAGKYHKTAIFHEKPIGLEGVFMMGKTEIRKF